RAVVVGDFPDDTQGGSRKLPSHRAIDPVANCAVTEFNPSRMHRVRSGVLSRRIWTHGDEVVRRDHQGMTLRVYGIAGRLAAGERAPFGHCPIAPAMRQGGCQPWSPPGTAGGMRYASVFSCGSAHTGGAGGTTVSPLAKRSSPRFS